MITVYDINLTDILPEKIKYNSSTEALSYAIRREIDRIKSKIDISDCFGDIDKMPDKLCDYMASELDALYYDKSLPVERKRELIKIASGLHKISGTQKALEILVNAVLGESTVKEWFDMPDTKPYLFDIVTDSTLSENRLDYLNSIVKRVKSARSMLKKIKISHKRKVNNLYIGVHKTSAKFKVFIYE